ncbi:MAG: YcaO-like family protein [Acetobacteraceae bacterium]
MTAGPRWRGEPLRKTYRDGTHRAAAPEETLARVRPFMAMAGITRVAMLTGLDVIGIPVAAAYRPNSRSVAVHQGKGASVAAAKVSAVMEAIEMFHAETLLLPLRLAAYEEMRRIGPAADPLSLPRTGPDAPIDQRLLWAEGVDLVDGAPVWAPYELVGLDLAAAAQPGEGIFQATTNGLASGNHWTDAVASALYEVVERDAVALWQSMPAAAQDARALDLATVDHAPNRALLQRFSDAGLDAGVWDVTSDIGLPAFACLVASAQGSDGVAPELGFGCHADRDVALSRALTEAAQARLTVISGARDDIGEGGYRDAGLLRQHRAARDWLLAPARRDYRAVPSVAGDTLAFDLDAALACLARAGLAQVICFDLTRPDIGIPVVRVIVPGLEGPWTPPGGEYTPGRRAQEQRA